MHRGYISLVTIPQIKDLFMTQDAAAIVGMVSAFILGIVWFARLEAKVMFQVNENTRFDKEIDDLRKKVDCEHTKIDGKFETMAVKLNEIGCSLARIEGALSKKT